MRVVTRPLWTSSTCPRRSAHVATDNRDLSHDSVESRELREGD
jgi:hypothetical protein